MNKQPKPRWDWKSEELTRLQELAGTIPIQAIAPAPTEQEFGHWVSRCLTLNGLTAAEVASSLEFPSGTIARWITGSGLPTKAQCIKLAGVFGRTSEEVLRAAGLVGHSSGTTGRGSSRT